MGVPLYHSVLYLYIMISCGNKNGERGNFHQQPESVGVRGHMPFIDVSLLSAVPSLNANHSHAPATIRLDLIKTVH